MFNVVKFLNYYFTLIFLMFVLGCSTYIERNQAGVLYLQQHEYVKAEEEFKKAIEENPMISSHHHNLGSAYFEQGNLTEAIAHYKKAIELFNDQYLSHLNLGEALHIKGDLDAADNEYRQSQRINPYTHVYFHRVKLAYDKGTLEQYVNDLQLSIQENNLYSDKIFVKVFLRTLALQEAFLLQDRHKDVIEICSDIIGIMNGTKEDINHTSQISVHLLPFKKRFSKNPARTNTMIGQLYYYRGRAYFKAGDIDKAIKDFQASILKTNFVEPHYNLARAFFEKKDYGETTHYTRKAFEAYPNQILSRLLYAITLKKTGKLELANKHRLEAMEKAKGFVNMSLKSSYQWQELLSLADQEWKN